MSAQPQAKAINDGAVSTEDTNVDEIFATWLKQFGAALEGGDVDSLIALSDANCH
ncbi:MAG: hypothetical protein R3E73_05220 [Porticoccaceae bacterium]